MHGSHQGTYEEFQQIPMREEDYRDFSRTAYASFMGDDKGILIYLSVNENPTHRDGQGRRTKSVFLKGWSVPVQE